MHWYFMYIGILPTCVCVKVSDPLKQELHTVVSCRVDDVIEPGSSVRAATVLSSEPSLQACHLPPHPQVLSRALMYIPQLGKYAESILENGSSSGRKLAKLQRIARQAVAALCALGGFK